MICKNMHLLAISMLMLNALTFSLTMFAGEREQTLSQKTVVRETLLAEIREWARKNDKGMKEAQAFDKKIEDDVYDNLRYTEAARKRTPLSFYMNNKTHLDKAYSVCQKWNPKSIRGSEQEAECVRAYVNIYGYSCDYITVKELLEHRRSLNSDKEKVIANVLLNDELKKVEEQEDDYKQRAAECANYREKLASVLQNLNTVKPINQ